MTIHRTFLQINCMTDNDKKNVYMKFSNGKGHNEPKRMGSSCIFESEYPMRNSFSTPLASNAKLANINADCQYSH